MSTNIKTKKLYEETTKIYNIQEPGIDIKLQMMPLKATPLTLTNNSLKERHMESIPKQVILRDIPANHDKGKTMSKPMEPSNHQEAISCTEAELWIQVIKEEYD
jgi:hypothetical protein